MYRTYNYETAVDNRSTYFNTTYKDTHRRYDGDNVEGGGISLDLKDIRRGYIPPKTAPSVVWDSEFHEWIRSPNRKYNFNDDTLGHHFTIQHKNSIGQKELYNPMSTVIGEGQKTCNDDFNITALEDMGQTVKGTTGSNRKDLITIPNKWSGIDTTKLMKSTNSNTYGRWYRTASNINKTIQNSSNKDQFLTTKKAFDSNAHYLFNKLEGWKKGENFEKYAEAKNTSISDQTPGWMQIPGIRLRKAGEKQTQIQYYAKHLDLVGKRNRGDITPLSNLSCDSGSVIVKGKQRRPQNQNG